MKMKRKLFAIVAMVLCVGSFAGCAKQEAAETMDPMMEATVASGASSIVQELVSYDETAVNSLIMQYEDAENSTMVGSLESWLTTMDEVGAFVQVDGTSVEFEDNQYIATVDATFEKRPAAITIYFDKKGAIVNMEYSPYYSLGENMSRAAVHTLIGMGTVFIVLIFISLIIGCFKYINAWEKSMNAKNVPAPAPAAVPVPVAAEPAEEEELVDDLELVAVITAAIAASMNTSTDGLVVRSIKRKSGAKWKRA